MQKILLLAISVVQLAMKIPSTSGIAQMAWMGHCDAVNGGKSGSRVDVCQVRQDELETGEW